MHLSYYVVDENKQFCRASRDVIERLWERGATVDELDCILADELRLVTVVSDDELQPVLCYFVRLDLREGAITARAKIDAFEAMTQRSRSQYDHPKAQHQLKGWPPDWQKQLAVALDVPASELRKIGVGGPLLMSKLWGIPLEQVIEYFEEVDDE